MSPEEALELCLREAMTDSTDYSELSNGVFAFKAPTGTDLPYSTFFRLPTLRMNTLRTTWGYQLRVQIKAWANFDNVSAMQSMVDATVRLFHARDDEALGTSVEEVMGRLNSLTNRNGYKFGQAEAITDIPFYEDLVGDVGVLCGGHVFEFWLQAE